MDKDILKTAAELRHRLHRCAELSGQEKQTKAMLIDFLRTHTSLELHDMGAWFYAVYKAPLNARTESAPTRRIAFRADFDALPIEDDPALPYASENRGVAHKCGHDGHSAALCAHLRRKLTAMAAAAIFSFFSNMRRKQAAVLPSAKR